MTTETAVAARKMWRVLEAVHGLVYLVPEAEERYRKVGVLGRAGYLASRSAPLGPAPAEVVTAVFFTFAPDLVAGELPAVWTVTSPAQVLMARRDAVDAAMQRLLGAFLGRPELEEAAELARTAARSCRADGRPLYGGHAALEWPVEPHLVLWHAATLLREHRGDGHIAIHTARGLAGIEALVMHAGTGDTQAETVRRRRGFSETEWKDAAEGLAERGWLNADGTLTAEGRRQRQEIEDLTDELASEPWAALGPEGTERLRELTRPLSRSIVEQGVFNATVPGFG